MSFSIAVDLRRTQDLREDGISGRWVEPKRLKRTWSISAYNHVGYNINEGVNHGYHSDGDVAAGHRRRRKERTTLRAAHRDLMIQGKRKEPRPQGNEHGHLENYDLDILKTASTEFTESSKRSRRREAGAPSNGESAKKCGSTLDAATLSRSPYDAKGHGPEPRDGPPRKASKVDSKSGNMANISDQLRLPASDSKWVHWRRIVNATIIAYFGIYLVAIGCLEPPLDPNHVRLRWASACGDTYFSDIEESQKHGVRTLLAKLEQTGDIKVSASAYKSFSGNQQYITPRPDRWLRNGFTRIVSAFESSTRKSPYLPRHAEPGLSMATASANPAPSPDQRILHLMTCMDRDRARKMVQQERIDNVATDHEMLEFMRRQYGCYRGRIVKFLSLKRVRKIFFVKILLPMGGSVHVQHHKQCLAACDCMPPAAKVEPSPTAEYQCFPIPPKTLPPVPPEYLAMLFEYPSEVHKDDTWILNQLPKRTCGQLQGSQGEPAEGWGIYYQEGWDIHLISVAIFLIFLLASLLFGILWAKYHVDIQSAFGVSAWIATLGGIAIAMLLTRTGTPE